MSTKTSIPPDMKEEMGHIDCPKCGRETVAQVVVWHGEAPHTVVCRRCWSKFRVMEETTS